MRCCLNQNWRARIPCLKPVEMLLGRVPYEPGSYVTHVYPPATWLGSLLYVKENGAAAGRSPWWATTASSESRRSLVAIRLPSWGLDCRPGVVQSAGVGFRINALVGTGGQPWWSHRASLLLRYTQALITQMGQTAVCSRHHSLDQQLCR